MVLPVSGVFVEEGTGLGPYYRRIEGYRQKKPYTLMLPLVMREGRFSLYNTLGSAWYDRTNGDFTYWCLQQCGGRAAPDNNAYARFIGKAKGLTASLGQTLGEHKAARDLVTSRSLQLLQLSSAILRRDFRRAYRIVKKPFSNKSFSRNIADLYLEWSWGWSPMVTDLGQALEVLVDPVLPFYVRAGSSEKFTINHTPFTNSGTYFGEIYSMAYRERWLCDYYSSTGAKVLVDNPNVVLANRLGLLDVVGSVWAVQPFSFIVDKYFNVGQMLASMTDLYGFQLSEEWKSRRMRIDVNQSYIHRRIRESDGATILDDTRLVSGRAWAKQRSHGLLGPSFALRNPSIGSFGEAFSYMALLYQMLSGKKNS